MKRLEAELDEALDSRDREARRADSDRREVARLQERILALEAEQGKGGNSVSGGTLRIAVPFLYLSGAEDVFTLCFEFINSSNRMSRPSERKCRDC